MLLSLQTWTLLEDREMLLSVRTCMGSLLVEDMEMLFVSTYLDSLLLEDREMILSVHSWTLV